MTWNIPNILSILRLALLPFMVVLFLIPFEWAAWLCLGLYIVGAITDFLDGYLARKWNQVSEFGAFIDPLLDKIFVVTTMLMLVAVDRIESGYVLAVVVILVREFVVSGVREYLGSKDVKVPVTKLAKWKTAAQMLALGVLIIAPYIPFGFMIGLGLLIGAAILTAITGWGYLKVGLEHLKKMA